MEYLDLTESVDVTQKQQQLFLKALNKISKSPVDSKTLRDLAGELHSIDTLQELDRNMVAKIENHLKGINVIKEICKHQLTLPEAQDLVTHINHQILPLEKRLKRYKLKFEKIVHLRSPDLRVRRREILSMVVNNVKNYLRAARLNNSDLNFWTAGVVFRFYSLPLEYVRLDSETIDIIRNKSWRDLNRKEGGEGWRMQEYIRRLTKDSSKKSP